MRHGCCSRPVFALADLLLFLFLFLFLFQRKPGAVLCAASVQPMWGTGSGKNQFQFLSENY